MSAVCARRMEKSMFGTNTVVPVGTKPDSGMRRR